MPQSVYGVRMFPVLVDIGWEREREREEEGGDRPMPAAMDAPRRGSAAPLASYWCCWWREWVSDRGGGGSIYVTRQLSLWWPHVTSPRPYDVSLHGRPRCVELIDWFHVLRPVARRHKNRPLWRCGALCRICSERIYETYFILEEKYACFNAFYFRSLTFNAHSCQNGNVE